MHLSFAKNGDFIIGGSKSGAPLILRTDSLGEIKWKTWYYDSIKDNKLLSRSVTINSICETSSGQIVCAAGDPYPDINSSALENYAAYLEFDSLGRNKRSRQWDNQLGSAINPFHIQETNTGNFLMSGYESVFFLDSTGMAKWKDSYSFMLDGVGSKTNRISRAKQLRVGLLWLRGRLMKAIAGPGIRNSIMMAGGHQSIQVAVRMLLGIPQAGRMET